MGRSRRSDLPTVPPPFDVSRFAKSADGIPTVVPPPSDVEAADPIGAAALDEGMPQSEMRIATRPHLEPVETDESWARTAVGVLVVRMSLEALKKLPLDHRAGYLLSRMDGTMDLETLVEVAAMPREDALRMVRDLFESGVVAFV
ncbi:MAG TPA: hypothetical protein VHV30_17645 [Polyangiaceae bacterium]|nr:hypothetical protein [Polyangiaceae bacterium]